MCKPVIPYFILGRISKVQKLNLDRTSPNMILFFQKYDLIFQNDLMNFTIMTGTFKITYIFLMKQKFEGP